MPRARGGRSRPAGRGAPAPVEEGPTAPLRTTHAVRAGDARDLVPELSGSIDLVVTSPPYPMVAMWDDVFTRLDPRVGAFLGQGDGDRAFERMHLLLDEVWRSVARACRPGGWVCVNVGDATRSLGGAFRLYPNHVRMAQTLRAEGLHPMPGILWRKPTNKPTKFMGSGMLPAGAYVTLEHEHILLFRRPGPSRTSPAALRARRRSACFWEERNRWFSDVWTDLRGVPQEGPAAGPRARSAAFPWELAHRLVSMHSVQGDTVLDPFAGMGSTALAALFDGRNSVSLEIDGGMAAAVQARLRGCAALGAEHARLRLGAHRRFMEGRSGGYPSRAYEFQVVTRQEQDLWVPEPSRVRDLGAGRLEATYASWRGRATGT